jgi:hypothetical protein
MRKIIILLIITLLALPLSACIPSNAAQTEQDTIAIYQAVIRQIYHFDDTFGGTLEKPVLYIVRATDDSAGLHSVQHLNSIVLSEAVQQGITDGLADLPAEVIWIEARSQVVEQGLVSGGGVVITLGNIAYENNRKAVVPGGIYVANMAAGGQTYILEKIGGTWTITGTTGTEWIS